MFLPKNGLRAVMASLLAAFFALGAPEQARADGLDPDALAAPDDCRTYIPGAARHHNVPAGLLEAIAMAESGRPGAPWPWTLNIAGEPYWLADVSRIEDLVTVNGQLRDDVALGCMQIFTKYHKDNFDHWRQMIDPRNNVYYAAWFLRKLYLRHGSWTKAVGHYHASTNNHYDQRRYACIVMHHQIALGRGTLTQSALDFCSGNFAQYLRPQDLGVRTAGR